MKLTLCRHGYIVDEKGKRFEMRGNEERLIAAWNAHYSPSSDSDTVEIPEFLARNFLKSTEVPRFKRILEAALNKVSKS